MVPFRFIAINPVESKRDRFVNVIVLSTSSNTTSLATSAESANNGLRPFSLNAMAFTSMKVSVESAEHVTANTFSTPSVEKPDSISIIYSIKLRFIIITPEPSSPSLSLSQYQ